MERRRMLGESGGKVIDLSMVDNEGNERSSMTTANCYLVHKAGKYILPLVYGNAIKNGADNRVAYYPGENGSIANGTNQFVNHNGDGITGPWITKSGTGVNGGMGLTVLSAELLWLDAAGLISAVGVDGDYLTFTVGTFTGGNALIAVKDGSGTILWSWHIWATDETFTSTTAVNTGSHTYNVADVTLGWVPTGGDGKQGIAPYYQWGRKDPFISVATYTGTSNHKIYNIDGEEFVSYTIDTTSYGIQFEKSTNVTIADNIKNPIRFYYNNTTWGPVNTSYYNMWDAQNTSTDNVATPTKKTIYDPCPPEFCVPTGNLLYYFGDGGDRNDSNWDSVNRGKFWTLNGANIYFPTVGLRVYVNGSSSGAGTSGFYWSATPCSTTRSRAMYFDDSVWRWNNNPPSNGMSIRPVME